LCLYHLLLNSYEYLTNIWKQFEKAAILIHFLTYHTFIVSIDFVDMEYIGIDTNIVSLYFFCLIV
jgi:hypothetical protein